MSESDQVNLDLVVLEDDEQVCQVISEMIKAFYATGEVHSFTSFDRALEFLVNRQGNLAIFVLDVFLGQRTAFDFLDRVSAYYPMAHEDSVIITGMASDEVVDQCMAKGVNHLLEKPLRPHALQLAIKAIGAKYASFAKRLLNDPDFADKVVKLDGN